MKRNFQKMLIAAAVLSACSSQQSENNTSAEVVVAYVTTTEAASDLKKMLWLQGSWKGLYNGKPFYEAWHVLNDSMLMNYEIKITDTDTLIKESGSIHSRGENFFYGTESVNWKLSTMTPNELVFKNFSLPYSQTILWKHTDEDHWYTKLSHPNTATAEYDLIRQPELDAYVITKIKGITNK